MRLKIKNITKTFNNKAVLKKFSLTLNKGQIVTIVGESGSGKSTLLRILNNLETVDTGTIQIDDTTLVKEGVYTSKSQQKAYQQKIGLVFQDFQLFNNLTVKENLLIAPLSHHIAHVEQLEKEATQLLAELGIQDKEDTMPSQLSGGQKQRVAIARALMLNPEFICFDEPTSALDLHNTQQFAELVKTLIQREIGIMIITHDHQLVKLLKDRTQIIESTAFVSS